MEIAGGGAAAVEQAHALARAHGHLGGAALLRVMIERVFAGRIAVVTSFGAESAVLLHMVAEVDPATPVIFLDTLKHFPETLAYRDALAARLGLCDVRTVRPDARYLAGPDPDGELWRADPDLCCRLRKVLPLERALAGFAAWVTGRKRYQGGVRGSLAPIEAVDGRIKINPLARWPRAAVRAALARHRLPRHPLAGRDLISIGCAPCTALVARGEEPRAGRWQGTDKTECGIHLPLPAQASRTRAP